MDKEKTTRHNRVREALGKLYDQEPPYFREYLRRFKEDPTSRVFAPLAEAYRRLGRVDEAIEICREGLGHHPDFHGGRVALAKCFLDKKWYQEARAELERVVSAAPENLLAQRLMGDAALALRDRAQALHCYKMALLLSPNDVTLAEKVHALERDGERDIASDELIDAVAGRAPGERTPKDLAADTDEEMTASEADRDYEPERDLAAEDEAQAGGLWPDPSKEKEEEDSEISLMGDAPAPDAPPPAETTDADRAEIEALLGGDEGPDDDSFKIEHVSAIFNEETPDKAREITTGTLGDLYFQQGQHDRALRIFEKLAQKNPTPELMRKINACRVRLGVDHEALVRARKIETLRAILKKVRA